MTSLADIATLALPWNPTAATWRFGTLGAASKYVLTAYFGSVVLCWNAAYFRHGTVLRGAAIWCGLCAVGLLLLVSEFVLSTIELRHLVPASEASAFSLGAAKATLKYGLFTVTFFALTSLAALAYR